MFYYLYCTINIVLYTRKEKGRVSFTEEAYNLIFDHEEKRDGTGEVGKR